MSVEASRAVWRFSKAEGNTRLVLLAIADNADDTGVAWPSHDTLSTKCLISVRAVIDNVARLEALGEVRVARKKRHVNVYRMTLGDLPRLHLEAHQRKSHECRFCTQTGGVQVQIDDANLHVKRAPRVQIDDANLHTNHKELKTNHQERERAFDEFWNLYPMRNGRKLHKAKAQEQFARIKPDDWQQVVAGARNYARACASGETIAADAFRWLRDRSFAEWAEPASGQRYRAPEPAADVLRCEHRYPIIYDDDGPSSGCGVCTYDDLVARVTQNAREAS